MENKPTIQKKSVFGIFIRGMAMGGADVVPGVSGGTVAFITGIYQELIQNINQIGPQTLHVLKKQGIKSAWEYVNGRFLASLLLGIAVSIISLAKIITTLLHTYPVLVWSFFFGLIAASMWFVGRQITTWHIKTISALIFGTLLAYMITIISPSQGPDTWWYLFLSGAIAIVAMILPGISGAFILLLMGSYERVMTLITQLKEGILEGKTEILAHTLGQISIFAVGALVGLKSFAKLLQWLFQKHPNLTLAFLTGCMLGSLNKVWPWKQIISTRLNSKGEIVPLLEKSVLPQHFEGNPQLLLSIALAIAGFLLIFSIEKIAVKFQK
jgi:putative membrane protein